MLLMVGVVGMNVQHAVKDQRFRADISLVVDILRFAQDLMLIVDTDVEVIFAKKEGKITVWLETEAALTAGWNREIERTKRTLQAVDTVKFAGQSNEVRLAFFSGGSVMSQGILQLIATGHDPHYVCLPGYPHPLQSTDDKEVCVERLRPFYVDRLNSVTKQEIINADILPSE